ncbi:LLM class F420-dependent oxidoreductase [Mycolicibacterium parafortuitum]|uniref:TIGR03619 family F420-dependent LLM class oxidoreductase n=1 Tax=Mycolicibacterium parafortuitum TaxID=39692 RepID=UPI0032C47BC2
MRLGLSTPIVVQVPGVASDWESGAGTEELSQIARAADELGYEYLTCSEHVGVPSSDAAGRGAIYFDPLATLSFLAAQTRRIRLATAVLVLGYHHPLEIAKRYGTLDLLSGGRLVLGVGIGSLKSEFELLEAVWPRRAARADDAIAALRASLSSPDPRYDGPFFSFDGMTVRPHAVQTRVPIWVGGRSAASLTRATRLADGWMPFGLSRREIVSLLETTLLPTGFDVVLPTPPLDPEADSDSVRTILQSLRDAGATVVNCTVRARSAPHFCEQLARLADIGEAVPGRDPR